jgi:hypothetical protein
MPKTQPEPLADRTGGIHAAVVGGELFMGHSGSRRGIGQRIAVAALAVGVTAGTVACSAGAAKKSASLRAVSGPSSAAAPGAAGDSQAAAGSSGTPAVAAAGPVSQPAAGSAAAGGAAATPGAATGATQSGGAPTTATKPPATTGAKPPPVSTGPAPVATGAYHYKLLAGSYSTLTIGTKSSPLSLADPSILTVSTTGAGMQQWVNASTTTNLRFTNSGVFLLSETVPLFNTTCTFDAPVASPPWPLAVGKAFSGQATCGQGSSASTLTLSGRVTGAASLPLEGAAVSTFLVQTTLTLSGTTLRIGETDWYAPSLRLPVKSTVAVSGGVTGYSIASSTTYTLTSSRPS